MFAIIIPDFIESLWITLFLAALAMSICLPACASMLSGMVSGDKQGRIMWNNQSLQVGTEALPGFSAGLLAAVFIKLPLIVISVIAVLAGLLLLRANYTKSDL